MKLKISLSFILALLFNLSFAQEIDSNDPEMIAAKEKNAALLDSLYLSGSKGYNEDIVKNMSFPRNSVEAGIEGLLIIEISVNENAEVSARFMTKLDDEIQNDVTNYLILTSSKWMYKGEPYKLYLPISYGQGSYDLRQIAGEVDGFPKHFKSPFLTATTWNIIRTRTERVKINVDPSDPRTPEEIAKDRFDQMRREGKLGIQSKTQATFDGATMKAYINEKEKLEKFLSKENFKKAYQSVSQLIRYNPFDIQLIQQRVRLEKELGKDEYRKYDVPWISVLMELSKSQ